MKKFECIAKKAAWLLGASVLAGLSACGGDGDGDDGLQKYREQTVKWAACDPSILGRTSTGLDAMWTGLGERLQCVHFSAPMDYANVEHGDVSISVMRVAAGAPAQRRGALVFNPGGPGADGLGHTFGLLAAFAGSNPASPLGAMNLRLLAEYDMVGFSPRGTGSSTQYKCGTTELERFVDYSAAGATDANFANRNYNAMKAVEACRRNPIAAFINTDATARDMDLLRGLLGDDKINYLGYSYGTWLGAWYAGLFPERVGRMVLDSSTDFTASLETTFLMQPKARQRLLDKVMVPYALRHAEHFNLGLTEEEVRAVMPSLDPKLQHVLAGPLSGAGYQRSAADAYLEYIAAARGLDELLKTLADPSDDDAVEVGLRTQVFVPSDRAQNRVVRDKAVELYAGYHAQWLDNTPQSIERGTGDAVYWAVRCNDTPSTIDLGVWAGITKEFSRLYAMFFSVAMSPECAYWGGPSVKKPGVDTLQGLDVMLVQSEYDTATATEGANNSFAALPKAKRVYVPTDYQHGVYPYQDSCVDGTVTAYLLGQAPAVRETVCAAKPLAKDQAAAGTMQQKSAPGTTPEGSTPDTYLNPEQAQELIQEFKDGLVSPLDRRR